MKVADRKTVAPKFTTRKPTPLALATSTLFTLALTLALTPSTQAAPRPEWVEAPVDPITLEHFLKSPNTEVPIAVEYSNSYKVHTRLGAKLFARGCEEYPSQGLATLANEFADAYASLVGCLAEMPKRGTAPEDGKYDRARHLQKDARILLGMQLNPYALPIILRCRHSGGDNENLANAVTPPYEVTWLTPFGASFSNTIELNLDQLASVSPRKRVSTMRHELMHLLGYAHNSPDLLTDLVYNVELCCGGRSKTAEYACSNARSITPQASYQERAR